MNERRSEPEESSGTLLLVDDEPNVLRALGRLLRREPYRLLTAESGAQALEVMSRTEVDVVVTDSRMPGMDGAELLRRIQQQWPDCLCLMLTGHADMSATVRAINEGRLFRYVSKPWNDDELRHTLQQAFKVRHTERERLRLELLTQQQNIELAELNKGLEQRVIARTLELEQVANMLESAYGELKRSYFTATRVFSSLINRRVPRQLQTNSQVTDLVKAFAEQEGLGEDETRDLLLSASLYNLGKLTWNDRLLGLPSERLFAQDRDLYRRYPETGESLLMALEYLKEAATLVRHHRERWNGSGFPDRLKGMDIPFGARVLCLAVDFIELQRGMILPRKVPRHEALELLRKFSGRIYDPELSKRFIAMCHELAPDLGLAGQPILTVNTNTVVAGMILAQDLHSPSGVLLLNEGKELTYHLVVKLKRLEEMEGHRFTLLVRQPSETGEGS
ncbi:response regulator [Halomonas daqingensis]|uniref:Response regulator n=1 Tax=Billgrantia desiderata TaxID=52021 RepID=A0AAW4YS61_9GAMM|nr:HD domain-containing phosphohydrolase [Halomonas desiderata]MCE8051759.1 response regulator [Halomonas desiderata]